MLFFIYAIIGMQVCRFVLLWFLIVSDLLIFDHSRILFKHAVINEAENRRTENDKATKRD